eukprot:4986164-Ditylum_brightwellii.AAC.1
MEYHIQTLISCVQSHSILTIPMYQRKFSFFPHPIKPTINNNDTSTSQQNQIFAVKDDVPGSRK